MRILVAVITLVFAAGMAGPGAAEKTVLDRVVAVVDDEAIFKSDVEQTVRQLLVQQGVTSLGDDERAQLERQALDQMISQKLVVAKAKELGIDVSFSEIEKTVERAIEENKRQLGGEAAFERQLKSEGLTAADLKRLYREQIRNQMLMERVLQSEIDRSKLQPTDAELRATYEERKNSFPPRPAVVHLATIFFAMESSENAKANALAEVQEIYRRVQAGEDFGDLAREYSQDPSAKLGGELGSVNLDDLADREFARVAASLDVGEVSEPVLTSYGYHLIQVTGKDPDTGEVTLRHILIRIEAGEGDVQKVFEGALEVHQAIVAGAPFDSMAAANSDDRATAAEGGDLGWLQVEDLPEFFRDVLNDMSVGDVSQVLREPSGFRIVKLLDREGARPFRFEEVRDQLVKIVQEEKLASTYDNYVKGLRDQFYVDVRY